MDETAQKPGRFTILWSNAKAIGRYLRVRSIAIFLENLEHVIDNGRLFSGLALLLSGLFGFESDRFCDGNTAAYLSCTRPSTYYYFSYFDIALIILGAFLIVLWLLDRPRKKR